MDLRAASPLFKVEAAWPASMRWPDFKTPSFKDKSAKRKAYPSIAELSKEGTCMAETKSFAKTQPSALKVDTFDTLFNGLSQSKSLSSASSREIKDDGFMTLKVSK